MKSLIYDNWNLIVATITAIVICGALFSPGPAKPADINSCFLIPDNKQMADCVMKTPLKKPRFNQAQYDIDPYYCFGAGRYDAMSRGWNCKDNFKESLIK